MFERVKDDTKPHDSITLSSLPPCSLGFLCESFVNVKYLGIELGRRRHFTFCGTKYAGHCTVISHQSVYSITYRPSSREQGTLKMVMEWVSSRHFYTNRQQVLTSQKKKLSTLNFWDSIAVFNSRYQRVPDNWSSEAGSFHPKSRKFNWRAVNSFPEFRGRGGVI